MNSTSALNPTSSNFSLVGTAITVVITLIGVYVVSKVWHAGQQ